MDALPTWPSGTAAILTTAGPAPHAIPVSTAIRAGDRRIVFALAKRRESLARLREDPRAALTILAEGDIAITAHGHATVLDDAGQSLGNVAAVALEVEHIQDHNGPHFAIEAGVRWRWTDPTAEARDATLRAALKALAD